MREATLEELINRIAEAEPLANQDPLFGDPRTRIGRETQKRMAETSIKETTAAYNELVKKSAFFIAPEGSIGAQLNFGRISGDEADTLQVYAPYLYERLAKRIFPSMGGVQGTITVLQESLFMQELQEVMKEWSISSLPFVHLPTNRAIMDEWQLTDVIRTAVREVMGDELLKMALFNSLTSAAVKQRYTASIVPVVVTELTQDEVKGLQTLGLQIIPVKVKEDMDSEAVLKVLTQVRTKLKKQSS